MIKRLILLSKTSLPFWETACDKRVESLQKVSFQQLPNTLSALGIARKQIKVVPPLPFCRTFRAVKSALSTTFASCVFNIIQGKVALIPLISAFVAIAYTQTAAPHARQPIATLTREATCPDTWPCALGRALIALSVAVTTAAVLASLRGLLCVVVHAVSTHTPPTTEQLSTERERETK